MEEKPKFLISEQKREALEEVQKEHLIRVNHTNPEPPLRGEGLLKKMDFGLLRLKHLIEKIIPESLNPLAQSGAVANISLFICIVSGILMFFWYSSSVHTAYSSLANMNFIGQLVRSLHRYSADICMLFVLIHALQILLGRRFSGPRWLAWGTGGVLLFFLWIDGWSGYWLVWDEKAKHIALESTKILDWLPIFSEPVSRSFLTDYTINSLFFFLIFFFHMLIPLAMGVALWIHIIRLNRPKFLTTKKMALAIFLSMLAVSLIFPATSARPARMQIVSQTFPMDWLYMFPLWLVHSLGGGLLWLGCFLGSLAFFTFPWWMTTRHRESALVLDQRCNGCGQCFRDCPYNAITLLTLKEEKWDHRAKIDPEKCVGCGICVGACNPGAIIFPKLPVDKAKEKINQWMDQIFQEQKKVYLAFLCANSAGSDLEVNMETGESPNLPGYRIIPVPCSGWVHPLMIERALRKGAEGVLVVGCGPDPHYRTGTLWTELRLAGQRNPLSDNAKKDLNMENRKVRFMRYDRSSRDEFLKAAQEFLQEKKENTPKAMEQKKLLPLLYSTVFLTALGLLAWLLSDLSYSPPVFAKTELVISFSYPGELKKPQKKVKEKKLPPGMSKNPQKFSRARVPVRMRIFIDGKKILERSYRPGGLFQDSASTAIELVALSPGSHTIRVDISDSAKKNQWRFSGEKTLEFKLNQRRVVLFDKSKGFQWY